MDSIGLQVIRLLHSAFVETIVVFGLGLIGLICMQILRNCGCRVIGVDVNPDRMGLAKTFGEELFNAVDSADTVGGVIAWTKKLRCLVFSDNQ